LELESKELRFETSADGNPTRVEAKSELRAMAIVAELMIFANSSVAERIAASYPRAALLRRHPPPVRGAFAAVSRAPGFQKDAIRASVILRADVVSWKGAGMLFALTAVPGPQGGREGWGRSTCVAWGRGVRSFQRAR
jgi:hypothetical protein